MILPHPLKSSPKASFTRVVAVCALLAGLGSFSEEASAQIVQNGNFGTTGSSANLTNGQTGVGGSWTYAQGTAIYQCLIAKDTPGTCSINDWVNPGNSPNGGNFIAIETELPGTSSSGTISQAIGSLTAGTRYTLMFDVGEEDGPVTWTVTLAGTTLTTVTDTTAGWDTVPIAVTFTATTAESGGVLAFAASTSSGAPPIALLDGVSIPEPASVSLLGLGALGIAGLRKRRASGAS